MNYLSVCSGIEAATVAWEPLGFKPLGFSEIEEFPCAVLQNHYPNVKNFGDMTQFQGWKIDGPINILVGGTPCQSFSVAGLRKGLDDPRGNLCLTYIGIADKFKPRWIVWENVPGVLSSNGGRDFGSFLGALEKCGYGWSYRVLDAQWFGVAQRRRRVFVVGNLGSWQRAAAVLFERTSLRRDTAPSREKRQGATEASFDGAGKRGQECLRSGNESSLKATASGANAAKSPIARNTKSTSLNAPASGPCNAATNTKSSRVFYTHHAEITSALCAADGPKGVSDQYAHEGKLICMAHGQANAEIKDNMAPTLTSIHEAPIVAAIHPIVLMDQGESAINTLSDGTVGTLRRETYGHEPAIIQYAFDAYNQKVTGDITKTLDVGTDYSHLPIVASEVAAVTSKVRRLTPIECERLQGFPDNYTLISYRKKPAEQCPDSHRYKALGNSMAVPVMRWIGQRIAMVEAIK